MAVLDTLFYWPTIASVFAIYVAALYIYRLFFHPLARFPGPKLAALSLWYEFYFDALKHGQYVFRIKEMHDEYGPIVRISPDELHINDPDFIPELMPTTGRKTEKYPRVLQLFGFSEAAITTKDHDMHRMRRASMSRMFSKESVRRLEPLMQDNLNKLFKRLQEFQESMRPVSVLPMFAAFTNDLIVEYSFGINRNWLEAPEFNKSFFDMVRT
jgi:cytochrome P450